MIELSKNEAASLSKLAARGGGYPWGLCEEAAFASHWLVDRQLPAFDHFLSLLSWADKQAFSELLLQTDQGHWHCGREELCPIVCGAALVDSAEQLLNQPTLELRNVVCPLLLLPFVSEAAVILDKTIRLNCRGVELEFSDSRIVLSQAAGVGDSSSRSVLNQAEGLERSESRNVLNQAEGLECSESRNVLNQAEGKLLSDSNNVSGTSAELEVSDSTNMSNSNNVNLLHECLWSTQTITLSLAGDAPLHAEGAELWPITENSRIQIKPACLESLKAYAHRTYAPATEESRLSGAGAGTSDND